MLLLLLLTTVLTVPRLLRMQINLIHGDDAGGDDNAEQNSESGQVGSPDTDDDHDAVDFVELFDSLNAHDVSADIVNSSNVYALPTHLRCASHTMSLMASKNVSTVKLLIEAPGFY